MLNNYFTLTHYGFIRLSGKDAKSFLQGQVTCHLEEINETQTRLGARCTVQGRVVSIFRLFFFNSDYFLRLPLSIVPQTIASLTKYAIFSKVLIEDVSKNWKALGMNVAEPSLSHQPLPQNTDHSIQIEQGIVVKVLGEKRYEAYFSLDKLGSFQQSYLHDFSQGHTEDWQEANIKNKLVEIYPETTELFTPHDLNLPQLNAVSFTKGCYSGQEIVARMHYRGTLKQHLYCIHFPSLPALKNGDPFLIDDQKVGQIVDIPLRPNQDGFALVLLKDDIAQKHGAVDFKLEWSK